MKIKDDKELMNEKQLVARDQEILRLKNELEKNGIELEGIKTTYLKKT